MSDRTKAMVRDEVWTAAGTSIGQEIPGAGASGVLHVGTMSDEDTATVAACAPEALRLLFQAEFVFGPGGNRACPWCQKVITPADLHTASCSWLALMRKAGLR